jgi:hypothetical protein
MHCATWCRVVRPGRPRWSRDVLTAGMRLEPTGRNPRHYTVGFDDLDDGVRRLASCPHQVVPNSYYDA